MYFLIVLKPVLMCTFTSESDHFFLDVYSFRARVSDIIFYLNSYFVNAIQGMLTSCFRFAFLPLGQDEP